MTNVMNNQKEETTMFTNLQVALDWLNIDLVLMNKAPEIDEELLYGDISGFWGNPDYDAEEDREDEDDKYLDEAPEGWEVYQYFVTNASDNDVRWLEDNVPGLHFVYSQVMDCWVFLCDCYGTSWDYVAVETNCREMVRELGEGKLKD